MHSPRLVPYLLTGGLLALTTLGANPIAQAEVIHVAQPAEEVGVALRSQSRAGVELHFGLDSFGTTPVEIAGRSRQTINLPGVILPNDAGAPDLPGLGRYIALPQGAVAVLEVVTSRTEVYQGIDVAPAPIIQRENDDSPPVYAEDPAIYGLDAYYPAQPVRLSEPMTMRGVDVVIVGITPFQYNPVTKELVVYTELDLRIDFIGGNGRFGEDRLRSRFWEPILRGHLLNHESLLAVAPPDAPAGNRYGYEYVIISPTDAGFTAWADSLKAWRKLQGISAEVFTTAQTGTTAAQIESWLNNAYNAWAVPPAAFLILGDYPSSGDGRDIAVTAPIYNSYCVSDNIYADVNGDHLPDMAHGRICARNATELGRMVTKMLSYERQPYTDPNFYDRPVIAGGWQTERWFILCTEVCYGFQANVLGKHPVREYAIYSGTPGTVWSTATNTSTVVSYFGPNGLGYIPATPQHLTDWGGSATRINNDLNAGAYMLLHRDHGYELGWGEPAYSSTSLNGLSNTKYPFVFSINCLTGKYNYSGETFTEKFHRMTYGAVGLIAASEVSYSFVNDAFVWGCMDGMWENFMPTYGPYPHGPDPLRTCFGMCYGKYFLQASNWPYNTSNKTVTYHLFHHHGDAFLRMQTQVPYALSVAHAEQLEIGVAHFTVQADAGALVSLTVDGEIIGVAEATGSAQNIPIIPQTATGKLRVTVTAPNAYRYDVLVPIVTGGPVLVAAFSGNPTAGCAPLAVQFTDESYGGEITSWSWTFGDGATSVAQHPAHIYLEPGRRTVTLTVSGPSGSDSETKTDYISVGAAPEANFAAAPTSGSAPLTVAFTDLSTGDPTAWTWDFGDLATATAQNPTHQYAAAGLYTVTLTASNACGSDVEIKTGYITVTEPAAQWVVITYDDFESGMGNYTDGGGDMTRYTGGTYAHQGSCAANIQDNSGVASSFYHTYAQNVTGYSALEVDFWFYAVSMERNEDFWVQYYDGSAWRTVAKYRQGREFSNNAFYHKVVSIPTSYAYPSNAKIRFMCDASDDNDDVYIDEIVFRGYRVRAGDAAGGEVAWAVPDDGAAQSEELETADAPGCVWSLERGWPNPFTGGTLLRFSLPAQAHATLEVFDVAGRRVATLVDGPTPAGSHSVRWDAAQHDAGCYFARLRADGSSAITRLVIVR